jgi:hypothetical protein
MIKWTQQQRNLFPITTITINWHYHKTHNIKLKMGVNFQQGRGRIAQGKKPANIEGVNIILSNSSFRMVTPELNTQ